LQHKNFVFLLVFGLLVLGILAVFVPWFFQNVILPKEGVFIPDVILDWLTPSIDWSLLILTIIYAGVILSMFSNFKKPMLLLLGVLTYGAVTWVRMGSMYFFTLQPPPGVIPLTDPFLSLFVYRKSEFVKDLFFSGHVSTMSVLTFIEMHRQRKWMLAGMTLVMSVFILWQHVHYTIDVLSAPIVTYGIYFSVRKIILRTLPTD
jgi:PAP2 superfamily C-terminal